MDPAIANRSFDPPRDPVLRRGLLPALLVNAALLVAMVAGNPRWLPSPEAPVARSPAQAPSAARPQPDTVVAASPAEPDTRTMGAAPATAAAAAGTAAPVVDKPSFDCAKARSRTEKLICSDPQLARLDRATGELNVQARRAAPDKVAFKVEGDRAWRDREARCADRECLLAWYAQRHEVLQRQIASAGR